MKTRITIVLFLLALISPALETARGKPRHSPAQRGTARQIVVLVHRSNHGLEYELRSYHLKEREANFLLAEIKLRECDDCQIVPIIDDDVALGVVAKISEMAINAGFRDIRPFVFWRSTGRMAQIEFGPVIRFTTNAEQIEQRIQKTQ